MKNKIIQVLFGSALVGIAISSIVHADSAIESVAYAKLEVQAQRIHEAFLQRDGATACALFAEWKNLKTAFDGAYPQGDLYTTRNLTSAASAAAIIQAFCQSSSADAGSSADLDAAIDAAGSFVYVLNME